MPRRNPIGTGGPRREIDQDALVTRYTRAGWSIARCGRAFGISTEQVRRVLLTAASRCAARPSWTRRRPSLGKKLPADTT